MLQKIDGIPRTKIYRALEILTGSVSWCIILLPPILAIWYPIGVEIFIIAFVLFWIMRVMRAATLFFYSYLKNKRYENLHWRRMLDFFSDNPPAVAQTSFEQRTVDRIALLKGKNVFMTWTQIQHVIIIPTYKEEKEILDSTFLALTQADFPLEQLCIVLATEERDKERAIEVATFLEHKYGTRFGQFHHVMHPSNIPDELAAKGANITYAGKYTSEVFKKLGIPSSHVLVTTLDADNRPHFTYFSNLTYHYLMEP
ncbi:hypothetical protein KBD59_05920, partial [Candidatus Gracilibacteria bacterium]|nr:hypothetical protein [Candidatus Gracilibacteria bacterium]